MCRAKLIIIFLLTLSVKAFSQDSKTGSFYRSKENKQYWKNRKPFEGYWQQDIHYYIKASLNDSSGIIDGSENLTYWNNSPDDLNYVYFHLYQNAFTAGSYLDNLQKNNKVDPRYGKYESKGLGTQIEKITVNGSELKSELDNTIIKIYLNKPLKSGDSLQFNIKFKSYFDNGSTRRRMKTFKAGNYNHYDGVLWYPRICVYDRKFGWSTDQHLNREFYGDFGSFDVELTLPNYFINEATGILQNEGEVLPDSLKKKLDIKNFAKRSATISEIIKPDGSTKTWKYHADNVHDFAFSCDPTYRIGEAEWNGVKCISVAQEKNASGWQNAASYASKIIKTYSEDIGMYVYPKMVVADAKDGMEYPMITLDASYDPAYRSLLCHEIGHNWFYGMVGSNETYRAFMDEGFTQFLTVWCLDKLEGKYDTIYKSASKYVTRFTNPVTNMDKRAYLGYIPSAMKGEDGFLNTHSDNFNGALGQGGGYGQVYSKTATMLYNLQYVLGDSLFLKSMQHYFNQWKICHPYPEDFRNSIINFTKVDLNWFFDQWLETDKRIDYGIRCIKKGKQKDEYLVEFIRKERMQMPIDFTVISNEGKLQEYHIPNTWFIKKTNAVVLPKWTGWDKLHPTYTASIIVPDGIKNIVIDSTKRLADINMLDNSYRFPLSVSFDSKIAGNMNRSVYELKNRPDVWYNGFDGIKAGVHLNGNYMNYRHIFDLNIWLNSGFGQQKYVLPTRVNNFDEISYRFNYKTPIDKISKNSSIYLSGKHLDGLNAATIGIDKYLDKSPSTRFYVDVKTMYRPHLSSVEYLLYQDEWIAKKFNNTVNIGISHSYSYKRGKGKIDLYVRSNTLGSEYDYNYVVLKVVNKNTLGKFDINTRTYAQAGKGVFIPKESALYLAGANPEEMMDNKYTRSSGFIDRTWLDYGITTNHFQMGGGLNLRGYAGYLSPIFKKDGSLHFTYKGTTGFSESIEIGFDRIVSIKPKITASWLKINTYMFADAGVINGNAPTEKFKLANFRADAGLGTAFTIKKWGVLQQVNPLTIRFDFPLFLNATPDADPDFFKLRWLMGINRTF